MKLVEWTDADGILRKCELPDGVDDTEAALGVPVGNDIVDGLTRNGMPFNSAVKLQNELRRRGLWRYEDVKRKRRAAEEIFAALQSAYQADVAAVIKLIKEAEENG